MKTLHFQNVVDGLPLELGVREWKTQNYKKNAKIYTVISRRKVQFFARAVLETLHSFIS